MTQLRNEDEQVPQLGKPTGNQPIKNSEGQSPSDAEIGTPSCGDAEVIRPCTRTGTATNPVDPIADHDSPATGDGFAF